jgi:hypothetical protein
MLLHRQLYHKFCAARRVIRNTYSAMMIGNG